MLTIIYLSAFCACVGFWRAWRRSLDRISIGSFGRRAMICVYWFLAFSILGDLIESLRIPNDEITHTQFMILLLLAVGTMPQVALFALVVTPVTMRGKYETYSFTKALIFMEGCALVSIAMLAAALIGLMHYKAVAY